MTWTYSLATLATSKMMQVRRLIGDVISNDQQIADEEINFALTVRASIYGAAADACTYIAGQYSRKADTVNGILKTNYSEQAKAYAARAARLEALAQSRGGALPYCGGISIADKQLRSQDSDRRAPQFQIGMEDNTIPVGSSDTLVREDVPVP